MKKALTVLRNFQPTIGAWQFILLLIALCGCLSIYNASAHLQNSMYFAWKQCLWTLISFILLLYISRQSPQKIEKAIPSLTILSIVSLFLVILFGHEVNGMRGWFKFGLLLFQPSEICKPIFILSLAALYMKMRTHKTSSLKIYLLLASTASLWISLIMLQPDYGTALIYLMTFFTFYWVIEGRIKYLLISFCSLLPFAGLIVYTNPYLKSKFSGFLNPQMNLETSGYHVIQFERTLVSGGLWGHDLGSNLWTQNYLPLPYSDSIFATLAESYGFIGVSLLISTWTFFAILGLIQSRKIKNEFHSIVCVTIILMLITQTFIHISVNIGLIPPTGITMPLFSYGGSSLLSTLICFGILFSFFRANKNTSNSESLS